MRLLLINIGSYIFYGISKLSIRKKNRWVFGSWFGNQASDNSMAVYQYVKKNMPEIEPVWVVRDPSKYSHLDCKVVKRNSLKGMHYVMTSKVAFFNQGYFDFSTFNLLGRAYKVQLWHGVPWKKICDDARSEAKGLKQKLTYSLVSKLANYDLYIAPSDSYANIALSAFSTTSDKVLKVGQPRNEALFDKDFCELAHKTLLKECGLPENSDTKVIVYMPTFRDKKAKAESLLSAELRPMINELAQNKNVVFIEKSHFQDIKRTDESSNSSDYVFLKPTLDAQTLLGGADMLITDYSSCFFDFDLRDKPIIHFAYDYEYYKNDDRGLYYDIDEVAAGSVAYSREELISALVANLDNPDIASDRRLHVRNNYVQYEADNNSEIIVKHVLNKLNKR